ncbi:hypothetical protein [Bifidobacterium cuniculi]|uniref:Uncharacterized protein n=1 Tax=Bifidobacterium cuniculi TaxID=1688 RepID=A0A087B3Y9_9BIFI|nr:hypothetical protein [Bifidobacterium cuniculi]KFI65739.1 hypothetical protein BCUN_0234 [Bifidobacterium cuniculi]
MKLVEHKCACGAWTIQTRPSHGVWDQYDPYLIRGGLITAALLLGITLDAIEWDGTVAHITTDPTPTEGRDYLQHHNCTRPPLSTLTPPLTATKARAALPEFLTSLHTRDDPTNPDPWARILIQEQPTLFT